MPSATQRDPRSIVTPDAFEISSSLVGLPLASPGQRALAILVDGIVIAVIAGLTRNFGSILGVVAAVFFIRAGFKRTEVRGSVFGRAMRFSVGCLGVMIGIITAAVWFSLGFGGGDDERGPRIRASIEGGDAARAISGALSSMGVLRIYEGVETREEAVERAAAFAEGAGELGLDREATRGIMLEQVPDDAVWADEAPAIVDSILGGTSTSPATGVEPGAAAAVAALSDEQAVREYADMLASIDAAATGEGAADTGGTAAEPDPERRAALESRLTDLVAAESIDDLEDRIEELRDDLAARDATVDRLRNDLDEATNVGLFTRLRNFADELGFGFGWAALYMTIVLSWWNGQTVGKRVVGIRVVRLDGAPITWWIAFERVGGYAAGFATGLLGFAQIWWDANRQAIHDRIVGTVVVVDGAEKVIDWESAL